MSMTNRLEWSRQVAVLNETVKKFLADPSAQQFDAAILEMRSYADAAKAGAVEIPSRFVVN